MLSYIGLATQTKFPYGIATRKERACGKQATRVRNDSFDSMYVS